jgi:hypothetical protein
MAHCLACIAEAERAHTTAEIEGAIARARHDHEQLLDRYQPAQPVLSFAA